MDRLVAGFGPPRATLLTLRHTWARIEIDLDTQTVQGQVELTVVPTYTTVRQLKINCRQCTVLRTFVDGIEATFTHNDPLVNVLKDWDQKDVFHYPQYKKLLVDALEEGDGGELAITLPDGFQIKTLDSETPVRGASPAPAVSQSMPTVTDSYAAPNTTQTQGQENLQSPAVNPASTNVAPVTLRIDFVLARPLLGLHFAFPDPVKFPYRWPHAHTSDLRNVIPCVDSLRERGTWDLEFVVAGQVHRLNGAEAETHDTAVICTGDLVEQVAHPTDSTKKIVRYRVDMPLPTASVAFAVGPFDAHRLERWPGAGMLDPEVAGEEASLSSGGIVWALPGRLREARATCGFLSDVGLHQFGRLFRKTLGPDLVLFSQAYEFFVNEFLETSYPYSSFNLVAVDNVHVPLKVASSVVIFGSHLLIPEGAIEQTYETRRLLARSLAQQWFGHYLTPRAWNDTWLCVALAVFVTDLFLGTHFGHAEVKIRMKQAVDRLMQLDVHQLPLYPVAVYSKDVLGILGPNAADHERLQRADPLDVFHHDFESLDARNTLLELKGGLVMYMLDRRLGKGVLQKVIAHLLLERTSGEMPEGLATQQFIKQCTKAAASSGASGSSSDVSDFAKQWIYGSGMPTLLFRFQLNRRKQVVEVQMQQFNRSYQARNPSATRIFSGPFVIRVHEPAGSFDTDIQVDDEEQNFELQYHSRSRRVQRNNAAAGQGPGGIKPEAPDNRPGDVEQEEEVSGRIDEDFEWIRLDPENEWLCLKEVVQNSLMWETQLIKDRDLLAQQEAVRQLAISDSLSVVESLANTVRNDALYHGIRVDAARSLAAIASSKMPNSTRAIEALLQVYRELFCLPVTGGQKNKNVPKVLEVLDLSAYFVQKGLLGAIASTQPNNDYWIRERRNLLLDQLRSRDRNLNSFDDSCLLASLVGDVMSAIMSVVPTQENEVQDTSHNFNHVAGETLGEDIDDSLVQSTYARSAATVRWQRLLKPEDVSFYADVMDEVRHLQALDQALPTYQNVLTGACLKAALYGMLAGLYPVDLLPFLTLSRYGNFLELRLAAFDALLLLGGFAVPSVSDYILLTMAQDPVSYVRFHIARSLAYYAMYLTRSSDPEGEPQLSAVAGTDANSLPNLLAHVPQMLTDNVRERIQQDNSQQRSMLWSMLNDRSSVDVRIRRYLLLFCRLVYEPNPIALSAASEDKQTSLPLEAFLRAESPSRQLRASSPVIPPEPNFLEHTLAMLDALKGKKLWAEAFRLPVKYLYPELVEAYSVLIKHPMDLGTIEWKLKNGKYRNDPKKVDSDVLLIFQNCYSFNQESQSGVYKYAQLLERFYIREAMPAWFEALGLELPEEVAAKKKLWDEEAANATEVVDDVTLSVMAGTSLTVQDLLKRCRTITNNLMKKDASKWFRIPVDPIKDQAYNYYEVIKHPMSFKQIREKLDNEVYASVQGFVSDVKLIISNAFLYNPPGTGPYKDAQVLEKAFETLLRQHQLDAYGEGSMESPAGHMAPNMPELASASTADVVVKAEPGLMSPALPAAEAPVVPAEMAMDIDHHQPAAVAQVAPMAPAPSVPDYSVPLPMPFGASAEVVEQQPYVSIDQPTPIIAPVPIQAEQVVVQTEVAPLPAVIEPYQPPTQPAHPAFVPQMEYVAQQPTVPPPTTEPAAPPPEPKPAPPKKAPAQPKPRPPPTPQLSPQEAMAEVLKSLEQKDISYWFREPVSDEVFPDYRLKISNPIALSDMKQKLEEGQYLTVAQFDADFRLLVRNAHRFNAKGQTGYKNATDLNSTYFNLMKKFNISVPMNEKLNLPDDIVVPPPQPEPVAPAPVVAAPPAAAAPSGLKIKLKLGGGAGGVPPPNP